MGFAAAQTPSFQTPSFQAGPSGPSVPAALGQALYGAVAANIRMPVGFATRDTLFRLSLPQDEAAEIYVQLTVGRNGKVKEKLTRVNANHIAGYVAPAFLTAVHGLRVDESLTRAISGKDTLLTLTFPVNYQCVLDTVNKEMPSMVPRTLSFYNLAGGVPETAKERERMAIIDVMGAVAQARYIYRERTNPTRVWYYIAFIGDREE